MYMNAGISQFSLYIHLSILLSMLSLLFCREVQNSVGSSLVTPAKLVPVEMGSGSPVPVFTGTSMANNDCWPMDSRVRGNDG